VAAIAPVPLAVSSSGMAAVRLKCPSTAFEGCAGTILIEALDVSGSRRTLDVRAARRATTTRIGKRRFQLAADSSATLPVRLDRGGWLSYRKRKRVRVRITVTMETVGGVTTNTRVATLRPAG
jgi:hypothetical protein